MEKLEKKKIVFHTTKQRVIYDKVALTVKQLEREIYKHKPAEIYNSHYSNEKPFIIITEYVDNGFMQYCTGSADKTPQYSNASLLYLELKYQGFEDCYFHSNLL